VFIASFFSRADVSSFCCSILFVTSRSVTRSRSSRSSDRTISGNVVVMAVLRSSYASSRLCYCMAISM
jgi:hypothetical protein